ncbi:MAG: response regulator transcription factor [Acidimicrobiales bacterium]
MTGEIDQGREAFRQHAWADAFSGLSGADREGLLELDDLERLAVAAYLTGLDTQSTEVWTRAHQAALRVDDVARAVRCAFWLAFGLLNRGELARGGGWVDRAQRLLDDRALKCVEHGYLRYCVGLRSVFEGDASVAHAAFSRSVNVGDQFGDPQLAALARVGQGRCLIYLGQVADGVALLDEAMVAVTAHEVSPIAVGDAYCTVIEACQELFDLRRVHEWTAALSQWCDSQPTLVLYRGQCLIHRAEIMHLHGAWSDAVDEVGRACDRLARAATTRPAMGAALYLRAELHRLRGEFASAEASYGEANEVGRDPQPGLALMRLAQGQVDAAHSAMRRALDGAGDPVTRARLLAPYVEICLAASDVAARTAADELSAIAAELNADFLRAASAHCEGAVLLGEGDARGASAALHHACTAWRALDAPYELARARVLFGLACRSVGDADTAKMELDAACRAFKQLGALPDLARAEELSGIAPIAGGLTKREVEVLALVAGGKTNRAIADTLFISEKTVARHVSNIFTKLGLSSRSAATAYAYEHKLL